MKIFRLASPFVAGIALSFVVSQAFAQGTPAPTSTHWNLGPLWSDVVLPLLVALVPPAAAWLAYKAGQMLHIQSVDGMRGALETAMSMGLQLAQSKLPPGTPITIDVRNQLAADALNYVTVHARDAKKFLGYSDERIAQSLAARASALMPAVVSPAAAATMQAPIPSSAPAG